MKIQNMKNIKILNDKKMTLEDILAGQEIIRGL